MNLRTPWAAPGAASLLTAFVLLLGSAATAQVPQTIVVDGSNDFDPANLLEDDGGDTQEQDWCTDDPEIDTPMDIKEVYVTNDTNNLYIGFVYDRECFASPAVNLGIAFSYGAEGDGGVSDPFARKIAWNTITRKPDNVIYAVIDGFNFEAFYEWQSSAWVNVASTINPSYGNGSDGLGMANDLGFEEISIPLSAFVANGEDGLQPGETLYLEFWMTQDGTSKPALDAVASDDAQTSTSTGTTFDVGTAVEMSNWLGYVVQNATDADPPIVTNARKDPFAQDHLVVTFNEPVDPITAENVANYALVGSGLSVLTATRDAVATNIVSLALDGTVAPAATTYQLDVTGVQDLAGNVIDAADGSSEFAVKEVTFRGLFGPFLQANAGETNVFTVEGSKAPLDFDLVDEPFSTMTEVDPVEGIYELDTVFSWYVGPAAAAKRSTTFPVEWKFAFDTTQFESIGNRLLTLSASDAAAQVTEHYWDDLDPSQFTTQDIDVIFTVDMNGEGVIPGDTVELAGSLPPLSFSSPLTLMADDGSGQDAAAGDGVYTAVVTFPAGSLKNLNYKYVFNGSFECFGQGDRTLFLNDALYDTIGGTLGPLVLPLATYDRCTVIAGDSEVVFSVDLSNSIYDANTSNPILDVRLAGNVAPLVFDPIGDTLPMADDGVAPDATAGDLIFTVSVVFPDSSNRFLEYKYVVDGTFEGLQSPNRSVTLSDDFDASGNPQVLPLDDIHVTTPVSVDTPLRPDRLDVKAMPNPFNPRTSIVFEIPSRGDVSLLIYDTRGRQVRTLHTGVLDAGQHQRVWDGKADDGRQVSSGVYFARVLANGLAEDVTVARSSRPAPRSRSTSRSPRGSSPRHRIHPGSGIAEREEFREDLVHARAGPVLRSVPQRRCPGDHRLGRQCLSQRRPRDHAHRRPVRGGAGVQGRRHRQCR